MSPRRLTLLAAGAGAAVTLLVIWVPWVAFAYRSPSLHVALETAAALIAGLTAYLVSGRLRERASVRDVLLLASLFLLACSSLVFAALPIVIPTAQGRFPPWAALAGALLGASTLALAALAPDRRVRDARLARSLALWSAALALLLAGTVFAILAPWLPPALPPGLVADDASRPTPVGHPAILAGQLAATALLAVASLGFLRRAERSGDELMRWLAAGAALGAFARLNYFLFPSLYSQWVSAGDLLILGSLVLVLVGAGREIQGYWARLATLAVHEERRRIARDLHDGLAQELAFIVAETKGPAAAAAERALDESRRAIATLTRPVDEPLGDALARAAADVASRVSTRVRVRVAPGTDVSPDVREAVIRIVREAVTNAARHGQAGEVDVEVAASHAGATTLRIADDGTGFDPAGVGAGRFGLVSMRERAEAVGGRFALRSAPGVGTVIEVALP